MTRRYQATFVADTLNPALLTTALAAVAVYAMPAGLPGRELLGGVLVVLAPLAALLATTIAARAAPARLSGPWALAAAAALLGVLSRLPGFGGPGGIMGEWHVLLGLGSLALLAGALGWLLHQPGRHDAVEIGLDAALVLATAVVATLRWSPAARTAMDDPSSFTVAERIGVLGTPVVAGCALLFGAVLLIVQERGRVRGMGAGLFAAAGTLGAAAVPLMLGVPAPSPLDLPATLFVAGWLALAWASLRCTILGAAPAAASAGAGGERLRLVVAPTVALVMAAVVLDSVWARAPHQTTAIFVGVVGLLLSVRISHLLFATRAQAAQRIELQQSHALIEVSRALAGTTRLDETLGLVTQWAARLLDAPAAAIELLSDDGASLELRAVHGLPSDALHLTFPVEGSFTGWVVSQGRPRSAIDARTDPYVHRSSLPFLGSSPVAAAPLRYRETTLGALSCVGHKAFTTADLELLGALAEQAAVAIQNARLFQQVHQLSLTDALTGLPNRRHLERELTREFAAARRGRPLVAVMFDLNGFKQYNDQHGHLAGDEALRLFAEALAGETRRMNTAARYGGDEFIALLADADADGTQVFIERVRERFPGPEADDIQASLSVTAGFAEYVPTMERPEDLVAAADRALYAAKSRRSDGASSEIGEVGRAESGSPGVPGTEPSRRKAISGG